MAEIIKSISVVGEHGAPGEAEIPELLQRVCDLVKERFNLYYVGAFLIEPSASGPGSAVLAAGTGEAGQKLLAEGYRLQVGDDSVIGWATANRQARVASSPRSPDVLAEIAGAATIEPASNQPELSEAANPLPQAGSSLAESEARRFTNPYLPETRSELALPVLSQQAVIGALTIQSETEDAFDQDDILVMQGIADALANAIENERLFAQTQADLAEIQALHQRYLRSAWDQYLVTQGAGEAGSEYLFEAKHPDQPASRAPPPRHWTCPSGCAACRSAA